METSTILLTPSYDSELAYLWQSALPTAMRVEADSLGPGFLEAAMLYRRASKDGPSVRMARWTLVHDGLNGRILRLTFPESRAEPKAPYDEIVAALRTIEAAHVPSANDSEPYRFGLEMSSRLILEWLVAEERTVRAALTPPFIGPA